MKCLVLAILPLAALSTQASAAEKNFMVTGFESLAAAGPHKIVVTTGKPQSIHVEGARESIDRLEIDVEDNVLRIGEKSEKKWLTWKDTKPLVIHVTTQRLNSVRLSGSGDVAVDRMNGQEIALRLSGSGDLNVGIVKADSLDIKVAGSGNVALTGTCSAASVSIAGSGNVEAAGLKCQSLAGSVSGSGDIKADVNKTADLKVMGSGNITITGKAKCEAQTMGSGRVVCGDS